MKKILRNNRIIAIALLTMFSVNAFASNTIGKEKELPIEFRFIGLVNEKAVFELKVAATDSENDYVITISDQTGASFYRENIKSTQLFSKKFLFSEDINDNTLLVSITCRNNNKTVVYKVENKYNYTQETLVSEVIE
jgi:hypothetical protein